MNPSTNRCVIDSVFLITDCLILDRILFISTRNDALIIDVAPSSKRE